MLKRFEYTLTQKELQVWADNAMANELYGKIEEGVNQK